MAKRKVSNNIDQASIENQAYNERAGAQKNMEVGRQLLPLDDGAGGKTTNATSARALPSAGKNLAIFNNSTSVAAVTLGENSGVTALAPGATDAVGPGHVGIPCTPNDWTFIACWDKTWVRASSATLLVFLIADDSYSQ